MSVSNSARLFRLFVSSTFSDFIAEREALQKVVFPELEEYCAKHGARFQAVDLRWGITEEAQREHDTMRICLEEVRRCQQLSPKPNFAVLLGDRYGWEPVPARIPQDHWRRLMKAAAVADRGLIEANYRLDENAVPPVYCLRERAQDPDAFEREAQLLQALRRTARGFRGSARLPYFASATHQEIALGALSPCDEQGQALHPEQHVHVYVRHLSGLPQDESAKDFIDWNTSAAQVTPGARDRLRGLERTLRERLPGHVHDLYTTWSRHGRDGVVNKAYLRRFCDAFLSHQKALIDAELGSLQQADGRQQREQAHQDFGAERARVFAGRRALLARIARYTEPAPEGKATPPVKNKPPAAPLILLGGGGSGKSALLARAAQEAVHQAKGSGAIVLQRYIGGVPGTESLMTTLTALTADIASLYGQPEPPTPENAKALAEGFQAAVGHATASRPLILYLDALDQLDKADSAWMLEWLPKELPGHVRVVASARKGTSVEQSARRRYPRSLIEVPAMKPPEGRAMLKAWLADKRAAWFNAGIAPSRGRRLTRQQEQAVLTAFNHTGSALWLKLAYEEAATWTSGDAPRELPTTVQGLIEDLIDHRLIQQENHPKVFTERALAYLTAGRFGLAENELGRALGTDKRVRTEFQANEKTQRKWEDEKRLPPILWSRLYFDLQAYLGMAQLDGARLMRWFHREFAAVLKARYLSSDEAQQGIHGALADTFLHLERELRPNEANDDALFKATDAGGKQVSAALRRVMEQPWQLVQAGRHEDLQVLLTDFGFCMGKSAANRATDLAADYQISANSLRKNKPNAAWREIILSNSHLLRRGTSSWPAHKIFLQLASEHAEDSPVTLAAEGWLHGGHCNWIWLCNRNRPKRFQPSPTKKVMEGHTAKIKGALTLPRRRLLTWSNDRTLRLWDLESGAELLVMEGHFDDIAGVERLPNGRLVSWCSSMDQEYRTQLKWLDEPDYALRVWDGRAPSPSLVLKGHTGSIGGAMALSDQRILSWSEDGSLRIWNSQSGASLAVLQGHSAGVNGARVLPDGRVLSWSWDHTLRLWDSQSGAPLVVLAGHAKSILGAQVLSDGRVLSWSEDCTLRLWDGASGDALVVIEGHTKSVRGAQILTDGRLMSWSTDCSVRIWNATTGACLTVLDGHTDWVRGAIEISGNRILTWSDDLTLRFWAAEGGLSLGVFCEHTGSGLEVCALADDKLLSWSTDGPLHLWDLNSGEVLGKLDGHTESILGVVVPDAKHVVSWATDRTARYWNLDDCIGREQTVGHSAVVNGYEVTPDGRVLTWSRDGSLRLWHGESGAPIAIMHGHDEYVWAAKVLPSGEVLSWSGDRTVRLWDGVTGRLRCTYAGHAKEVRGACLLADGSLLSWSIDGTLRVWDKETGVQLSVLEGHADYVDSVQELPGDRLLSWSGDGTLRVWDKGAGTALAVMQEREGFISLSVGQEGRLATTASDALLGSTKNYALRLWHWPTGSLIASLEGHRQEIDGFRFLSDGSLLSWSDDCSIRHWDAMTGRQLAVLHDDRGAVADIQELPGGRILSSSKDGNLNLWDLRSAVRVAAFSAPWIDAGALPPDLETALSRLKFHGARLLDGRWVHPRRTRVYVTEPNANWSSQWHSIGIQSVGHSGLAYFLCAGSRVVFLRLNFPA